MGTQSSRGFELTPTYQVCFIFPILHVRNLKYWRLCKSSKIKQISGKHRIQTQMCPTPSLGFSHLCHEFSLCFITPSPGLLKWAAGSRPSGQHVDRNWTGPRLCLVLDKLPDQSRRKGNAVKEKWVWGWGSYIQIQA